LTVHWLYWLHFSVNTMKLLPASLRILTHDWNCIVLCCLVVALGTRHFGPKTCGLPKYRNPPTKYQIHCRKCLDMCSLTIAADFGVAVIPRIAISFPSAGGVWRSGNALVNLRWARLVLSGLATMSTRHKWAQKKAVNRNYLLVGEIAPETVLTTDGVLQPSSIQQDVSNAVVNGDRRSVRCRRRVIVAQTNYSAALWTSGPATTVRRRQTCIYNEQTSMGLVHITRPELQAINFPNC